MRNLVKTITLIILIAISLCIFSVFSTNSQYTPTNNVLHVGGVGDGNFTTIKEAIDSANPGDKIVIHYGVYNEDIKMNKNNLTLIGISKNGEKPVVKPISYWTIRINKPYCTLSNLHIICNKTSSAAILVYSSHCNISNNFISHSAKWQPAIELLSNNNIVAGNHITNIGYGIEITKNSNNNTIINNTIFNTWIAIAIIPGGNVGNNTIIQNTIENNSQAFAFFGLKSGNNTIYQNNFINNEIYGPVQSNNTWYSEKLKTGNYWDEYNGTDRDGDGIGDIPYNIPGTNDQDKYPLMSPYTGEIKEFVVDEESLYFMLLVSMIVAILFLLPIAYIWYRKQHKMK